MHSFHLYSESFHTRMNWNGHASKLRKRSTKIILHFIVAILLKLNKLSFYGRLLREKEGLLLSARNKCNSIFANTIIAKQI